jgi:hypothetical protein
MRINDVDGLMSALRDKTDDLQDYHEEMARVGSQRI